MRCLIVFFAIVFSVLSGRADADKLRDGDLLFCVSGKSDFSKAISSATQINDSPDFAHVAILYIEPTDSSLCVIEASPECGVRACSLSEFLAGTVKIDGKARVVVKRLRIDFPVRETIERAKRHLGEPYDWHYLPDNGMTYCSELVYDCYLAADGSHIFDATPMNFRAPDGSMPQFWTELYESLGMPVPEGIPGTNPNALSSSPILIEVLRFF